MMLMGYYRDLKKNQDRWPPVEYHQTRRRIRQTGLEKDRKDKS